MSNARVARSHFARRTRLAAIRLLASALAGIFLAAHGARTQEVARTAALRFTPPIETWDCTDHDGARQAARPPLEMRLKDGLLIEQPLGSPRYQLLADSDKAIIGVDYHADFDPVLGMVNIFVSTVAIDKSTGNFAIAMTVGDKVSEHRSGHCRMFEERASPADKTLAQRK